MRSLWSVVVALVVLPAAAIGAAEWNQWRGPNRDGVAADSPPLRDTLPDGGLPPVWVSEEAIRGGGNGGWASPVVAKGRVFQFVHEHEPRKEVELPSEQYPPLTDAQKADMAPDQLQDYEAHRRIEQMERREKANRYTETLFCFDAATGELVWKSARPSVPTGFSQSCTPAIADGRIYFHGADRRVVCLDADTGQEVWQTETPVAPSDEAMPSSPLVAEGTVVVLMGRLFGLSAKDGKLLWQADPQQTAGRHSSPVLWKHDGRTRVIINTNRGKTIGVDPHDGAVVWSVDSRASHSTPVVSGARLITFGHSREGGVRCFDLTSDPPRLLWTFHGAADPGSSPVVVGGHVYVQGENRLACVDAETGQAAWQTRLEVDKPRYTSLVAADGKVYYAFGGLLGFAATPDEFRPLIVAKIDARGHLASETDFRRALKMDELEQTAEGQQQALKLWQEKIGRHGPLDCASPALADGKLYLRLKSRLACYDLTRPD